MRERDERRGKNLEKQRVKMCGCWGFMTEDCEDEGWMAVTYVCIVAYVSLYCMSIYGQEKSWRSLKMSKFLKQGQNKA